MKALTRMNSIHGYFLKTRRVNPTARFSPPIFQVPQEKPDPPQANSTSIFLASASSLVILKVRIWLSARGSGLDWAAGALPCQRAFSIEERLDMSGLAALFGSGRRVHPAERLRIVQLCAAGGADAFAEFDDGERGRLLDYASGDSVADFVLGDVFVDAGGDELLHARV